MDRQALHGTSAADRADQTSPGSLPPRRLSVAPMLDWTDRHYRFFARLISRHTWLYTEMVTTGALLYGDVERHLRFDEAEHPLALQLGGSEPHELARCARLAEAWGYDEVNLNVGCPSERVQKGAFGACLMAESGLVADCVKAMRDAAGIDVTVKHRIGIDEIDDYGFVRDFVATVAEAGCGTFIVHARNAILKGLSPKENREVPPLKYHYAHQLKADFPHLEIVINGGLQTAQQIDEQLRHVDGVMIGRAAYHDPYCMAEWDARYYGETRPPLTRAEVVEALLPYAERMLADGHKLRNLARHILGLFQGMPGARRWRRLLSDARLLEGADAGLLLRALAEIGVSRTLSEANGE
ncbi:MAG: tRNA dihydrouridine(20/20a) synthase DusA [Paludibacterium sp.]|uniref:tRNA dihydrouridine(20/20a) synthase DusA n=1 Tax=Paludibacterium sp. TaxID=1917523 RepID=UPI0025DCA5B1|nr:tRNA dihydrouridine(20/20a) synthase DusA [Paludibacterium sp.]MBV8047371.1 tRNA dihydrouridine(20/20a) synthase DusA [Paludibacterium sp.]MBV8649108.1 tRNA dihydrouridine(20/20a) synthase DusA [Paludibacterium sp.]